MMSQETLSEFVGLEREVLEAISRRLPKKRLCFFPYIGGKFNLLKTLVPLIPPHEVYVEVFGGAANLLLNKPPSKAEVYNDVDGDLVNLFLVIRDRQEEFIERFKWILYSRELYLKWVDEPPPKDPVERAARYYYVLRCSFSGVLTHAGWGFKRKAHIHAPEIFWNALEKTELIAERLKNCYIDRLDFRRCFKNWDTPETFFFLDPPYYGLDYYAQNFSEQDHIDLRTVLGNIQGKWLMTYGDHPRIRELYTGFEMDVVKQRRCANKMIESKRGQFSNLLVANYPLKPTRPIQRFSQFQKQLLS